MKREPAPGSPWMGVALLAAVLCTMADLLILQRRFGIFTTGFLSSYRITGLGIPYYVLGSVLVDMAVLAPLAAPALWIARRLGRHRRMVAAALLCTAVCQVANIYRFHIDQYIGDTLQFRFAPDAEFDARLVGITLLAMVGLLGSILIIWATRFAPTRLLDALHRGARSRARSILLGATLLTVATGFLFITGLLSGGMQWQFVRKTTGGLLLAAGTAATDFDGDGFGLVRMPLDAAPFDHNVHPYAVDWPGNGVDENGIGGDLDARGAFALEHYEQVRFRQKPDVVLIVLESFRADNVTAEVNGKPVAPVLRRLLKQGAITGPAYSHNGYTIESLSHLFTGSLTLTVRTSIVDDFNDNGYLTACVSGEDESFGGIEQKTGLARAGYFRDARDNADERTSAFTTPGSLTVPWRVVVRNVIALLDRHKRNPTPLFAYVNLQDCHYPYTHKALLPLVADDPIPASEITPQNLAWVKRTYRNTAANVDHAVGRILDAWEQKRGKRPAYIIVSDHGESFFRDNVLGHGIKLTRTQTEAIFLTNGLHTDFTFPLGLSDVRRLLRSALSEPATARTASATIDKKKWIFQYIGTLRRPRYVGGATAAGGIVYNFRNDTFRYWGERPQLPNLARFWEQIVLYRQEHR